MERLRTIIDTLQGLTWHDISVPLGNGSIDYPGDTPYVCSRLADKKQDAPYTLSALTLSAHSGTHVDAPAHFCDQAQTIDTYAPQQFLMPAVVVDAAGRGQLDADLLDEADIRPGDAVLFRTDNSVSRACISGEFTENFVSIPVDMAQALTKRQVSLTGLDAISIEAFGVNDFPSHHVLLGKGILVLEGLDLLHAPPGRHILLCLPLKLHKCEASPVRAILLTQED